MVIDRKGNLHDDKGLFAEKSGTNLYKAGVSNKPLLNFKIGLDFFAEKGLQNKPSIQLRRGIRSKLKRLSEHRDKINSPENHCIGWENLSDIRKQGLVQFWEKEIKAHEIAIQERIDILKERGEEVSEYCSK